MKRMRLISKVLMASVLPVAAGDEVPSVVEGHRSVELTYPQPLVSMTVVGNGRGYDGYKYNDEDLGRHLFTITGDDKHKPIARWTDQDELCISFPKGTSCATEYTFQIKSGTTYLGGESVPTEPVKFRCPADKLEGKSFMDARGLGVVVCPHQYRTKESMEFSPSTPLRFVFRKAKSSFWTGNTYYVGRVEATVEPAYLKQGITRISLEQLQRRGEKVWSKLREDSPLPGHVVVRPVKPLSDDDEWHLLVQPKEGQGFCGDSPVCSAVNPLPELGTGVKWQGDAARGYRLEVRFSNPMSTVDMPALFDRMQLAVGTRAAKPAGTGKKKLNLGGCTMEFRYAGVLEMEPVRQGWRYDDEEEEDEGGAAFLSYVPQGQCMGFVVEVSATAPALLDVVLPADTKSYLGFKVAGEHRHRIALNPAWPRLLPESDVIVPLKGDRRLRIPTTNVSGMQVQAWRLSHDMSATAFHNSLLDTSELAAAKLNYDLLHARDWRGMTESDDIEYADECLSDARRKAKRSAARSRLVLKNATPFPGCWLPSLSAGMLQSGETVLRLDDALGCIPRPGMYLLRLSSETNPQVRSALRLMDRAEEMLDAQRDVVVQVTDLNVCFGEDAILVNHYSDGRPVAEGTISWLDSKDKPRQLDIRNGIAWLPQDWHGGVKAWVRSGADVVLVRAPFSTRREFDDPALSSEKASTLLVLDRPLYRPGDEVHVRGVLRRLQVDGSAAIPEEKTVSVKLLHPNGEELESRELPLGDFGAFETSFTLPTGEDDVTGRYEVQVKCGYFRESAAVRCEVFRRDAFKVERKLDIDPVAPESFTLRVSAVDYSGTPLSGARCKLVISGKQKKITLDAEGKAVVPCAVTETMRESQHIVVRGDVVNDREEYVKIKELRQNIYPADFWIKCEGKRIKLVDSRTGKPLNREQTVQLKLVDNQEQCTPGPNGLGYCKEQEVALWSGSLTVPANCELGLPFPEEMEALLGKADWLVATGRDAAGRCCETRRQTWNFRTRDEVRPELKVTALDGAAELLAELPHAGHAHVLVGCGQKLRHLTLPVQAGKQTYRVPLAEGEEGTLSLTLVLPGQKPGDKAVCTESTCFVPIHRYHLAVSLNLPQQVCRPAETITLSGQVQADGKPAEAEVTLYAVDAGMLSVGHYDYPDPEAYFFTDDARRFSLVRSSGYGPYARESLLQFMPGFWRGDLVGGGYSLTPSVCIVPRGGLLIKGIISGSGAMGITRKLSRTLKSLDVIDAQYQAREAAPAPFACYVPPGDEEAEEGEGAEEGPLYAALPDAPGVAPRLRTNFAPVAVWKGALRTDASGHFSAQVTLPDTLTTYEVIAVAVDRSGKRFGSSRGEFTVAQPVMLTPGTPLFMSLGDELRLPLSIVNNTDEPGTWCVTLEGAAAPQEIMLGARQSGTLFFDFKATAEGEQKLRWTAIGKPGSDAVQGEFSVRFPAPVLKETHRFTLAPGEAAVQLATLLGSEVGTATRGELELVASANPLLHLAGAADFLLAYPYGCTEQRASALIPWLLYEHLAPFCPKMAQTPPEDVKKVVQKVIDELLPRQCEDGGLSYWGGWNHSSLWATAHVGYVFKLAQEMGYEVPEDAMDKLYSYLWWTSASKESARTRFAIARTRGKTGQMKDILREMLKEDESRDWILRETKSSLQFMLSMLENPDAADDAFRTWMRSVGRDHRHGTTQGNSWTLFALVEYLNLKKEQGGTAILALQDGLQMQLGKQATVVKLPWQPGQEMKSLPTTLAAHNGTVYATLRVRALPSVSDYPGVTEHGLQVTRLYETRSADGVWRPATSFKVGDVVRVTLTCAKVADELKYLVLEDYLPACMEAINPNVPSQAVGLPELDWSQWFDHREYLADRVRGFCTRWSDRNLLNLRYYARVKRAGTSMAPPAQAQLMYEPQVYGLSPNARIKSEP
ncbi:MAG: hypothetical protein IKA23_09250 [Akkermansia sp.]|nr:hypothetical protein [Akkermansia sp.]